MEIPFTIDQFLGVFQNYNLAIWPMHIVAYFLGTAAVLLAFKKTASGSKAVAAILAFFWLWNGAMYHIAYFSPINKAAYLFGALFVLQGFLFALSGVYRSGLTFQPKKGACSIAGAFAILYAMVVYPIWGNLAGHGYPRAPMFGVAPCPTTIFTFGMLLWANPRVPKYLLAIPLVWSIIGFNAALSLGITEDFGLLAAGGIGTLLIVIRGRKP